MGQEVANPRPPKLPRTPAQYRKMRESGAAMVELQRRLKALSRSGIFKDPETALRMEAYDPLVKLVMMSEDESIEPQIRAFCIKVLLPYVKMTEDTRATVKLAKETGAPLVIQIQAFAAMPEVRHGGSATGLAGIESSIEAESRSISEDGDNGGK